LNNFHKIYVDAMVWIAAFDNKHCGFIGANQILRKLLRPYDMKMLFLSDHVLSEIFGYITSLQKKQEYVKEDRVEFVRKCSESLFDSKYVKILNVEEEDVGTGIRYIREYPHILASLSDWLSLILMVKNKIPVIQTFDRDFNAIINQISDFNELKVWKY
jgi:predicted nucleic acid-binding protein